jgi:lysophospholipase L1-like esterase
MPDLPTAFQASPLRWLALLLLVGGGVFLAGCTAWRAGEARALARASEPHRQAGANGGPRLLIVGDSTAVGTGASSPAASLAGLIGARTPDATIHNRARDGATWADLPGQLSGVAGGGYDIALLMAGGNDVIRLRDMAAVRADIERSIALAREHATTVVVMPAGNVGNAPFFLPPVSWWMTARARGLHAAVAAASQAQGAVYVNLFRERDDDPFAQRRELHAADGLHPSDAGYALWWQALDAQAAFTQRLATARR